MIIRKEEYNELKSQINLAIKGIEEWKRLYGSVFGYNVYRLLSSVKLLIDKKIDNCLEEDNNLSKNDIEKELIELLVKDNIIDKQLANVIFRKNTISHDGYRGMESDLSSKETFTYIIHLMATNKRDPDTVQKLINDGVRIEISKFDNRLFHKFLEYSIGNQELNKELDNLKKSQSSLNKAIYEDSIDSLMRLSYKSRHLDDLLKFQDRFEYIIQELDEGGGIEYGSRMSLSEYGKLVDIRSANYTLEDIYEGIVGKAGRYQGKLDDLRDLYYTVDGILQVMDSRFEEFANEHFKPGDIVVHNIKSELELQNRKPGDEEKFTLFTNGIYGHAALLDEEIKLSHVVGRYEVEEFYVQDALFSDVFRVDVRKLLTPEAMKIAKEEFGDDLEQINEIYRNVHIELDSGLFEMQNSTNKRSLAGANELLGKFTEKFGIKKGTDTKKLAKQEADAQLNNIYNLFFEQGGFIEEKMICSEFVAKVVSSCLLETDKILHKQLGLPEGVRAINIPFYQYDLDKVTPDQLIKVLKGTNCIERLPDYYKESNLFKMPEKMFAIIASGMTETFKKGMSKGLDSGEICTNLIDKLLEKHNELFSGYSIQLTNDEKNNIIGDIIDSVEDAIKKVEDLQGPEASKAKAEQNIIMSFISTVTTKVYDAIKALTDKKIDKEIYNDMKDIAGSIIDNLEKSGHWLNRVSNNRDTETIIRS
ncbi:hypothetical protein Cyrtocomes_01025 [Candidatus Cyrtobacter comes]|uniref:DUF4145 domain-containing protein n=1 Tax=Candidatus Cyrtobacter comes TaxID=675776 RepID=A0ABU5L931_9RICK|nr:hypothetical protein [Candidatus Cyrtobacter comes]MDZ5762634.1 hypothetical protein [Candidatus Cyrtobacter comes]